MYILTTRKFVSNKRITAALALRVLYGASLTNFQAAGTCADSPSNSMTSHRNHLPRQRHQCGRGRHSSEAREVQLAGDADLAALRERAVGGVVDDELDSLEAFRELLLDERGDRLHVADIIV